MSAPLKFPELRYFGPHGTYQMMPVINGEKVVGAPDFRSQAEAAWGVVTFYRELGYPAPAYAEQARAELDRPQHAGRREAVEAKVKAFIKDRKLAPPAVPAGAAQAQGLPQAPQAQPEPALSHTANPPSHDQRKGPGRR